MQRAAKIYTTANTVINFGAGAYHIAQGKGQLGDYISVASGALSAAGWAFGKMSGVQNCFVAGTEVLVGSAAAPGVFSEKAIEDIRVGDEVWTKDQNDPNAALELKQVKQVFIHTAYDLQKVSVTDETTGNVETYDVTDEHPFYVDGLGWTSARELVIGEHLIGSDGKIMTVMANVDDQRPDGVTVYNFEVEGDHTYFVADGQGTTDEFVWVHNSCSSELAKDLLARNPGPRGKYAAHLIPTGEFSNRSQSVRNAIKYLQNKFDVILGPEMRNRDVNGFFGSFARHGGTHTDAFFLEAKSLMTFARTEQDVVDVLDRLRNLVYAGRF